MKIYYYKGSNQHKKYRKSHISEIVAGVAMGVYISSILIWGQPLHPDSNTKLLKQFTFGTFAPVVIAAEVSLPEKEEFAVKKPKGMKTEIFEYLVEKFGDAAGDAIAIIRTCENGTFEPTRLSGINKHKDGHESIDVGVMQINVDVTNTAEIELLKGYKYNIDRGYQKWLAGDGGKHKNSFYLWTCAKVINQYNYVDAMKGK